MGIIACMNRTDTQSHSLQEFVARNDIASSCESNRQRARNRIERAVARQTSATPIPGIEVTYIEVDAQDWEQLAAA